MKISIANTLFKSLWCLILPITSAKSPVFFAIYCLHVFPLNQLKKISLETIGLHNDILNMSLFGGYLISMRR